MGGRTVSSLKGSKMLKRTIGHRFRIKVVVKGVDSIRQAKPMSKILRALENNKGWAVDGIGNLEPLEEIHEKLSIANNLLCDILRFTAPDFNPTNAAPPSSGPTARVKRSATPDSRRAASSDVRSGRRAASSDVRTGRRAASSSGPVGANQHGGHVRIASAADFNVAEFGERLRDSGGVLRDLALGSPAVRLSVSDVGVQIYEAGQALMTEGRGTPALRGQLQLAKDELNKVWNRAIVFKAK